MKWCELPSQGEVPEARSSHSITAIGDQLYLWGGEHAPRKPISTDLYCYDLHQQAWSKVMAKGVPPSLRIAHAAAAIDSKLYIFGGRSGIDIGEGSLNDLHCFDLDSQTWKEVGLASEEVPPKRSYHAMTTVGGKLYMFGGCGEGSVGRLSDLWEFNPATSTWRQLPSSDTIKGRGGAGFAAVPDALFVIAGFAGREMSDVHRFDLASESWDCPRCCSVDGSHPSTSGTCAHGEAVALPARSVSAVASHTCASCSHGNHVLVFGGEVDPSAQGHAGAGHFSNDTYCLDTACLHWHALEEGGERPSPRGWLAATSCAAGLVVHGGNSEANERRADLWLLRLH